MTSRWTAKSPMSGYAVAIAATLAVVLFRLLLSRFLGDSAYFFPFVIAVTLSAWYGGLTPGLLSTVIGALAAIFFFVPPYYSLTISDPRIATAHELRNPRCATTGWASRAISVQRYSTCLPRRITRLNGNTEDSESDWRW